MNAIPSDADELAQALEQATAIPAHPNARPESLSLEEMLARFVHVTRGPIIIDVNNTYRRLRPGEFAAAYAHDKVIIEKKAIAVTSLWAQSPQRMTAECLTFHPGEGQFFVELGMRHLNIWTPPQWPAVDPALAQPFLSHLEYLIPDAAQRADLLDWLAHAAQRPEIRPHFHFLLVAAQEGTGRSWVVEVLRRIWGARHAAEIDLHRLLEDSFNATLSGKILMGVHEVKAPADERYSHRNRLKSLLSDTLLEVNEKHERKWTERFCARFLMFTNSDDALPLSETDRRVYVVRCADTPRDAAYYAALYGRLGNQDFLAAVWHLLKSRDIGKFNPGRRAPLNEMKVQLINAGRTEEQQTAVEFVRACPYEIVGSNDLMEILAPRNHEEPKREHDARTKAVAAVLKDIGCQTYGKKVKVNHKAMRIWMLRNPARWSAAAVAQISREAESAHLGFAADKFLVDLLMARWET